MKPPAPRLPISPSSRRMTASPLPSFSNMRRWVSPPRAKAAAPSPKAGRTRMASCRSIRRAASNPRAIRSAPPASPCTSCRHSSSSARPRTCRSRMPSLPAVSTWGEQQWPITCPFSKGCASPSPRASGEREGTHCTSNGEGAGLQRLISGKRSMHSDDGAHLGFLDTCAPHPSTLPAARGEGLKRILALSATLLTLLTPNEAFAADLNGAELAFPWALPFLGILLSIALFPLLAHELWERHLGKIAAAWAALIVIPLFTLYDARTAVAALSNAILLEY